METKIAVAVVIAGLLIGGAVYLTQSNAVKVSGVDESVELQNVMRDGFIEGCTEEGTYDFCACAYDSILDELGVDGFVEFSLAFSADKDLTDKQINSFTKALLTCK